MSKQILIFGGAFDPPHVGHALVVVEAFKQIKCDELWLMPAYGSTFGKIMSPPEKRLNWLEAFKLDIISNFSQRDPFGKINPISNKIVISKFEIENKLSGSTWETYKTLNAKYDMRDTKLSFLMGSDQLKNFNKWEHYQELMDKMQFYVYPREGYDFEPWFTKMKKIQSEKLSWVSSSEIRKRLTSGVEVGNLLTSEVGKRMFYE